jgi:RNA polymerase sigma factor (sigma-70 family)
MIDDPELLRRYSQDGSQEAFTELVERHVSFVYGWALRRVNGNVHSAQDVTQEVFITLANNAAALAKRPVLEGWLYTTTRYVAAMLLRSQRRRQIREQNAEIMNEPDSKHLAAINAKELNLALASLLDKLSDRERKAVLLRFFGGHDFSEIGARLGLSKDGARSRVERALEKMRCALARRGITSTAAGLAAAFETQALVAAPAGLAVSVTGAALSAPAAAAGIGFLSLFFAMNKITVGVASALIIAGAATVFLEMHSNRALSAEIDVLRAPIPRMAIAARESGPLNAEGAELAQLRQRLAQLKDRPDGVVDSEMRPRSAWRNVGRATPEAALETLLWAESNRDWKTVADTDVPLSPASKAIVDAWFASLSEAARAKFGTPESLLASLYSRVTGSTADPVVAYEVYAQQAHDGPNETQVKYWTRLASGTEQAPINVVLRQGTDGWQRVIGEPPSAAVWQSMVFSQVDPATGEFVSPK